MHAKVLYTKIPSHSEIQTEKGIKRLKRPQALSLG